MDTCDAYVSLHRLEGFGRTMAEAMLLCKPVSVGEYPYVEESEAIWADPDRPCCNENAFVATRGNVFCSRVRDSVKEQFSPEIIGKLMRTRLEQIYRQLN